MTDCSASCGKGSRYTVFGCVHRLTHDRVSDSLCDSSTKPSPQEEPCNVQTVSCICSAECGSGSQQRAVVCLMKSEDGYTVMPPYECSSLDKPLGQQSCHMKACGAKWYYTAWSACSKTCEGGFRVREVRCLSDDMTPSEGCEEGLKPEEKEECNTEPCVPHIDENCHDKYFNCNVVVQARLCVYNYYKMACCASCTRVAQRQSASKSYR
ncbi:hypothetical protein AOLI_G00101560 [Acnodon oligacanthus]